MPSLPVKHEAALASLRVRDTTSGWCFVARGTALGQGAPMLLLFTQKYVRLAAFRHPYSVRAYLSGRAKDTWYSPNLKA